MSLTTLQYKGESVIIEGVIVYIAEDGRVHWVGPGRVDDDGAGSSHGDKFHQDETSLKQHGKSLNADIDQYIVVPPQVLNAVGPIVLGCQARDKNRLNGKMIAAVVGDIGPRKRIGELSIAACVALDINPNPNTGGVDDHVIEYDIWPGTAAVVGDRTFTLQAS